MKIILRVNFGGPGRIRTRDLRGADFAQNRAKVLPHVENEGIFLDRPAAEGVPSILRKTTKTCARESLSQDPTPRSGPTSDARVGCFLLLTHPVLRIYHTAPKSNF